MSQTHSLCLLRWALSGVLGGSAALLLGSLVARGSLSSPLLPIAAAESLGALLLLARATTRTGAWLLFGSLSAAALFHLAHRQAPPAAFLVYFAAVLAVAAEPTRGPQGA